MHTSIGGISLIYELDKEHYYRIIPLLESDNITDHPSIRGIIQGNNRGKIFVDSTERPRTALVWAIFSMYYFIGDYSNPDFVNALSSFVSNKLGPENLSLGASTFICTLVSNEDGWRKVIETVFCDKDLGVGYRQSFMFRKDRYVSANRARALNQNCSVQRVNEPLILSDAQETVTVDIDDFWLSREDFLSKGVGFCVLSGSRIVSSCISCYASDLGYDIVINTYEEDDRNKGYATLAASAFLDYSVENGITPHWETYDTNYVSLALAEKLGFEPLKKHLCYEFLF